jgi:hypothetical protein
MSHITPGGKGLGWRPSLPDHRDALYRYTPPIHVAVNLPPQVQLPTSRYGTKASSAHAPATA